MKENQVTHTAKILRLSHDIRGIANINGKTVFIANSIPGEEVEFTYTAKHPNYDEGIAINIIESSPGRTQPLCPHFQQCGGCSLQHLTVEAQLTTKTQILLEQLQHFGQTAPLSLLPPLTGPIWHYRSRARLSVKNLYKKNKILVGFHEKNGRYVADIDACLILDKIIGTKITLLKELIANMSVNAAIPQIEVAVGDDKAALIFRHLSALTDADKYKLQTFGANHNLQIYLQPHGLESIHCITNNANHTLDHQLSYKLPEFNVELLFSPADFTQINKQINRQLVERVKTILDPKPTDKILDLFCGLGNFTIPLAKLCGKITGVEVSKQMVSQAQKNAVHNNISNAEFYSTDLVNPILTNEWAQNKYDKIILDPPRTGALEIIQQIEKFDAQKIIYISCNPATFARDAKEIINKGYTLINAGIIDMFPHTKHVEVMGEFKRGSNHAAN